MTTTTTPAKRAAPVRKRIPPPTDAGVRTRQLYLTAVIALAALWLALPFLAPIAWATVLAIAEWPLVVQLDRRMPGRPGLTALILTLGTALLVILPLSLAAVTLAQESEAALAWVKHAQASGVPAPSWLAGLPAIGGKLSQWWQAHLATAQGANALLGTISAGSAFGWTRAVGGEVAKDTVLFVLTLSILFALLASGKRIAANIERVFGRMFGAFGEDFVERMTGAVRSTVNGTLLVSFLEGAVIGVGYWVAGVPQPLLFAFFTIVLALIPFGAWAAFGLASLILIGGGQVLPGIALFVFSAVIMTIGDNVVQPKVIGSAVELPFILAMLGAFGGIAMLGLVGLFIGPVVMVALVLVCEEWLKEPPAAGAGRAG